MYELKIISTGPPLTPYGTKLVVRYGRGKRTLSCQIEYDATTLSTNEHLIIVKSDKKDMMIDRMSEWGASKGYITLKKWIRDILFEFDEFWEDEIFI